MRKAAVLVPAFCIGLALILDIVGIVAMFRENYLLGIGLFQMATFLVLFMIWMEGP